MMICIKYIDVGYLIVRHVRALPFYLLRLVDLNQVYS